MENKGVIRKLDNLGRIVIPKEFRKFNGIKIGEPLEIFCCENGDIVMRKIDVTSVVVDIAKPLLRILSNKVSGTFLVCDCKNIICGYGEHRQELLDKKIVPEITSMLEKGRPFSFDRLPTSWEYCTDLYMVECHPIAWDGVLYGGLYYVGKQLNEDITLMLSLINEAVRNGLEKY